MQLPSPQPNPRPVGRPFIELSAATHSKIVCCSKRCCLNNARILIQRRSRASEYRCYSSSRVWSARRVCTLPYFSGLGVASAAAGCWYSTSTVDPFYPFCFRLCFSRVSCVCTVLHPRFSREEQSLFFRLFRFVFRFFGLTLTTTYFEVLYYCCLYKDSFGWQVRDDEQQQ